MGVELKTILFTVRRRPTTPRWPLKIIFLEKQLKWDLAYSYCIRIYDSGDGLFLYSYGGSLVRNCRLSGQERSTGSNLIFLSFIHRIKLYKIYT